MFGLFFISVLLSKKILFIKREERTCACVYVCVYVCVRVCMYIYISRPRSRKPRPRIPTRRPIPTGENGWSRKTPAHKSNNSSSYSSSSAGPGIKKRGAEAPQLVTNPLFLIHTTICPTEIRVFRRWTSPMSICSSLSAGGKTKEADDPHS